MDLGRITNSMAIMQDNVKVYKGRLRQILANLRPASSTTPTTESDSQITPTNTSNSTRSTYKPYIGRLKTPSSQVR